MFKVFFAIISVCLSVFLFIFSGTQSLSARFALPIRNGYTQTSPYGYRLLKSHHFHNGIDLAAPVGTGIYAVSSGIVVFTGFYSSYGNTIIISYYNGYKSIYGHCDSKFNVRVGESVTSDTMVGTIGPKFLDSGILNGNTTGPHLHFAIFKNGKSVNPEKLYKDI